MVTKKKYIYIYYKLSFYLLGRGKPGWGRETTRPPWWPKELPWANVRMDARCEDEKQKVCCYNLSSSSALLATIKFLRVIKIVEA